MVPLSQGLQVKVQDVKLVLRTQDLGFGSGSRVQDLGLVLWAQDLGFGFRVEDSGSRV